MKNPSTSTMFGGGQQTESPTTMRHNCNSPSSFPESSPMFELAPAFTATILAHACTASRRAPGLQVGTTAAVPGHGCKRQECKQPKLLRHACWSYQGKLCMAPQLGARRQPQRAAAPASLSSLPCHGGLPTSLLATRLARQNAAWMATVAPKCWALAASPEAMAAHVFPTPSTRRTLAQLLPFLQMAQLEDQAASQAHQEVLVDPTAGHHPCSQSS